MINEFVTGITYLSYRIVCGLVCHAFKYRVIFNWRILLKTSTFHSLCQIVYVSFGLLFCHGFRKYRYYSRTVFIFSRPNWYLINWLKLSILKFLIIGYSIFPFPDEFFCIFVQHFFNFVAFCLFNHSFDFDLMVLDYFK